MMGKEEGTEMKEEHMNWSRQSNEWRKCKRRSNR